MAKTAAKRKSLPKVDPLRENLKEKLKLSRIALIANACGIHQNVLQAFVDGGELEPHERKRVEEKIVLFEK
jgi:hypothetical protein